MKRIVVDRSLVEKLDRLSGHTELRDRDGRLLGYFVPSVSADLYRNVEIPFTDEELGRVAAEPGGRPLPEILRDLNERQ